MAAIIRSGESRTGGVGLSWWFYRLAVILMPVQLETEAVASFVGARIAPGDLALVIAFVTAPAILRIDRTPLGLIPVTLVGVISFGALLSLLSQGWVTPHALFVKLVGAVILAIWALTTAHHASVVGVAIVGRLWLVSLCGWSIFALVDWAAIDLSPMIAHPIDSRFSGTFIDPNNAGLAFGIGTAMVWQRGVWFRGRIGQAAAMVVLSASLALTLSRTAIVATVVSICVVAAIKSAAAGVWLRRFSAGFLVAGAVVLSGLLAKALDDFQARPDNVGERSALFANAWTEFLNSYGMGIGLGAFRQLGLLGAFPDLEPGLIIHNTPLWLLVEMGLLGAAWFVFHAVAPMMSLDRRRIEPRLRSALLAAHATALIASIALETLYQRAWWVVLGLALAAFRQTSSSDRSTRRALLQTAEAVT